MNSQIFPPDPPATVDREALKELMRADLGKDAEIRASLKNQAPLKGPSKKLYTPESLGNTPAPPKTITDPAEMLRAYAMTSEYISRLGNECWIYPNLIPKNHIITIVAMPNGGKTTFFFRHVAPKLASEGYKVFYIDADSPASEHKAMQAMADKYGFTLLNPDVNIGTSIEGMRETLKEIADSHTDLDNWVFFVDTLKKMASLMSKDEVKAIYKLMRKLTTRGATVILLAHANKFRDQEGNLIPEGVGDVRSDTDELIIFERKTNQSGGMDVTTVVDPDRNAKVRGIFKPFSFHISELREITFYDSPLPVIDFTATASPKATDDEIIAEAKKYLFSQADPVPQRQLVQHTADLTGSGEKRVRGVIARDSEAKDAMHRSGKAFVYSVGPKNSHFYELPK